MKLHRSKAAPIWRSPAARYATLGIAALSLVAFLAFAHSFLAVTRRVDADIVVIEGWIPDYMLPPSAREFHEGGYRLLLVSGLQDDPSENGVTSAPVTLRMAARLEQLGVPRNSVVQCPAPFARWLRTSKTARAVRDRIAALGIQPKGINVITAGAHARETWVAYQHVFGDQMPVGIISIPKNNYPPGLWWMNWQGLIWLPKDFAAWLKEVLFGLRS